MKHRVIIIVTLLNLVSGATLAQIYPADGGKVRIGVVKTPYSGLPSIWHEIDVGLELTDGPEIVAGGGLVPILEELGCSVKTTTVRLSEEEDKEFGVRHRLGIANGHLGSLVSSFIKDGYFPIGLQANDPSALGMLAGLQHSGPGRRPLKVGMVWIDAHADFNTPETSHSGMLGGMPVAIAAGLCLERLRRMSGLEPALPTRYIVLAGVLDTDPLEQELLDRSKIEMISAQDIKSQTENIHRQMTRLSRLTDAIYIHVDLVDIVDDKNHSGLELTFPAGPSSGEVAQAVELMARYEKVAALGIASYPAGRDDDRMFLKAAYNIIEGTVKAIKGRKE